MENKVCEYRNCNNQLEVIRKTKKFCCTNCRKMEQTYLKRDRKKSENNKLLSQLTESDISKLKLIRPELFL